MSLTGPVLPVVLLAAVLVVLVAIIIGPPAGMHRITASLVRTGEALGLSVLVLALSGVLLNNTYAFYLSWNDLLGVRSPVTSTRAGADPRAVNKAPIGGVPAGPGSEPGTGSGQLPPLPHQGRLQPYVVQGQQSLLRADVIVRLPEGYNPTADVHYPVIVALHGTPGEPSAWLGPMEFGASIDAAVAQHRIAAPILVMPQVNFPYGTDTECLNGQAGDPQVETWLAQDLPTWIAAHFRVAPDRLGWATAGYSAGGFCAAFITMHHPDRFGAALVYGGYFRPTFSPGYAPYDEQTLRSSRYDLTRLAATDPPPVALWVMSSKGDTMSYPTTAKLIQNARAPLSVTSLIARSGGHAFANWVPDTPASLTWLGRSLSGFAPR